MPSPTVLCPCCGKRLLCSYPPEPGQSMRCHGCGRPFTIPGKAAEKVAAVAPPRFPPVPVAVGAILLAAFLSAGGVVLAMSYFGKADAPTPVAADAPAAAPARDETPKQDPPQPELPAPVQGVTDINIEMVPPEPKPVEPGAEAMPELPEPAPMPKDGLIKDWLPKKEQGMVDDAVRRAVAFLKKTQAPDGSWAGGGHPVGATALPALALLECGVPANDPAIRKAAAFLRKHVPTLNRTYEISLCILFLVIRAGIGALVPLAAAAHGQQEEAAGLLSASNRTDEANLLIACATVEGRGPSSATRPAFASPRTSSTSLQMTLEQQNPATSGTVERGGVSSKPNPV